ncbi:hypothetical protein DW322_00375 [Rhodococcus rhodnii]|uniref:Uncharacterized protein n=2 Tax=Rhodococcus rhodnii TaxID=38312 RepID=R7WR96_9NOCA|nr:hypothetical protein [Rhodococcus rhodnii]EOM77837.1 hypothetical protein Rrhod_0823 [Rhodococcus rhodnii LMG 5362]TXG88976.1 hypothetical protein DW322_00375 [Rhodococcus rhodnii]
MARAISTIWLVHRADPVRALSDRPAPDPVASRGLATALLGTSDLAASDPVPLSTVAGGTDDQVYVGAYPRVTVVASPLFAVDLPSQLPPSQRLRAERTILVASHPQDASGAFALWEGDRLRRAFSATPNRIVEDIGLPQVWEAPFWAGEHPLRYRDGTLPDPDALPFHPQQFAEHANLAWLGFRYTRAAPSDPVRAADLRVIGFRPASVPALPGPTPPERDPRPTPNAAPRPDPITVVRQPPRGVFARVLDYFGYRE